MISDVLKSCGYPVDTVVLDAETYFDANYSLKKMGIYQYVTDPRFELLGWAAKEGDNQSYFSQELLDYDWKNITVVLMNAPFDALVLAIHNKLYPPFIVDVLDLARHIEPRWSNSLASLCKRHELIDKGETKQFSGVHRSTLDQDDFKREQLAQYATNDADREYDLLQLLLPKLSNAVFELRVMEYTRNLFIRPVLSFNVDRAEALKMEMQAEVQKVLKQVNWVLDYAD